jgi:phospholipase/carboxylesterase
MILGDYGPDVQFLDRALEKTFAGSPGIDPRRVALCGFSDGASYGLSLGLANGRLFTHIIAFSPGFIRAPRFEGSPRIFVTHGVKDAILPVDRCSRRLVPQLRKAGYVVEYREFDGPHTIPETSRRDAIAWLLAMT